MERPGKAGVSAEVSKVAEYVRLAVETVSIFPYRGVLRIVVKDGYFSLRNGLQICFYVFRSPVFTVVMEHPSHLEPLGVRVHCGNASVSVSGNSCQRFRVPGGGVHLIEKVESVNMVCAEQLSLFMEEILLDEGVEAVRRAQEIAAVLL